MANKEQLEWSTVKRKVSDLKKWKSNPRNWTEYDIQEMSKSLETYGYTRLIMVDVNNVIIAGNLCYHVLCLQGKHSKTIEVRTPNRKLTSKEFQQYGLMDNKMAENKWDFETLANEFGSELCIAAGFTERELGINLSEPIDMGESVMRSSEYDIEQAQSKAEREALERKHLAEKEKIIRETREQLLTDLKTGKEALPDVIRNRVKNELVNKAKDDSGNIDYSILDDSSINKLSQGMRINVRQSLLIEFEADDYKKGSELVNQYRKENYIGGFLITKLEEYFEKNKSKKNKS